MVKKIAFLVLVYLMLIQSFAVAAIKQQKLTAADGSTFDRFGWSVSISSDGNTMAVGVPFRDIDNNTDQGSVYVFLRSGGQWIQQQKLTAADGSTLDRFGWSVSISSDGNTMVVGAPYINISGKSEQGAAYVFVRRSGRWIQQQKLTASDGNAGDRFGWSVSMSSDGNTMVIGSPLDNIGGKSEQGAAYVFVQRSGEWIMQQKVTASDGTVDDHFSHSVSISGAGNVSVIGTPENNIYKKTSQGSVYVLSSSLFPNFTVKEWGIILFTALVGLWFIYYLRRQRKSKR